MSKAGPNNRLEMQSSPYLRQHAHNPVDWQPWDDAALAEARARDVPILLSIGYSACHWCHVMAHESFEDEATAALMNQAFVNIKVDREERPDLDRIYQLAQQMITGHGGGWPLTVFLTPGDQAPFFAGTYFPPESRHGMPAFRDILSRVSRYYTEHREALRAQRPQVEAALASLMPPAPAADQVLDPAPLAALRNEMGRAFDGTWGGFGRAPKFPHATALESCLRAWARSRNGQEPDLQALYMTSLTLTRMAEGGLQDQLGGGFFRYSTDDHWSIPHFEKMLYDNALLLPLYAQSAIATGEELFAQVARATARFLLRDLRDAHGGFQAALDADGPGGEGAHYLFTAPAVREALPVELAEPFVRRHGLDREPNFEGRWHLRICEPLESLASETGLTPDALAGRLEEARRRLFDMRLTRPAPSRDDKVLTAWNGLAIKGLAIAARVLGDPTLEQAATAAVDRLRSLAFRDGRLLACSVDGKAYLPAYLDDHAFLAAGLLELLQCRWRGEDLAFLVALLDLMLEHFEDPSGHGFCFTADDHERLLVRSRGFADESVPAGNAVAAAVFDKAGCLLGEPRYLAATRRTLIAGFAAMNQAPLAHAALINALEDHLAPPEVVIIRGEAASAAQWHEQLSHLYAPSRVLLCIPDDAAGLPASLAARVASGPVCAWRCTPSACSAPFTELAALVQALQAVGE
ncbi:MAG: thioredoxin domain-containing protein [Steroidobacteraceae bacterium]